MTTLTPKEKKIYQFIQKYWGKNGVAPTYSEIQDHFEYKAISSVQQFIEQLVAKGVLRVPLGDSKKRAIELVSESSDALISIPLEGYVAAGRLTEAVQNREWVDVPQAYLKKSLEYFGLKVRGDSMIDACILDGDLVIIRKQHIAYAGDTVVALVDGEATIKKYYPRKGKIELHPANTRYDVISVSPESEFKILGVLAGVIRNLETKTLQR